MYEKLAYVDLNFSLYPKKLAYVVLLRRTYTTRLPLKNFSDPYTPVLEYHFRFFGLDFQFFKKF